MKWVLTLLLCLSFCAPSWANDFMETFEHISFVGHAVDKVDDDVYAFFGWSDSDDLGMPQQVVDALISDLQEIKKGIENFQYPFEAQQMKESILMDVKNYIELLKDSVGLSYTQYRQLLDERFTDTDRNRHMNEKNKKYINEGIENYLDFIPEGFTTRMAELEFFIGYSSERSYEQALNLMDEKKYMEAMSVLAEVYTKEVSLPHQYMILHRMSDCIKIGDLEIPIKDVKEYLQEASIDETYAFKSETFDPFAMLERITDNPIYFPGIADVFLKWRTMYQTRNHGMSNMSDIPTFKYLQERKKYITKVKEYLAINPNDIAAKLELLTMLNRGIIHRMPEFGNSVLYDYHYLYMQDDEEDESL